MMSAGKPSSNTSDWLQRLVSRPEFYYEAWSGDLTSAKSLHSQWLMKIARESPDQKHIEEINAITTNVDNSAMFLSYLLLYNV